MSLTFTTPQQEAVFQLLLRQKSDWQMVRETGFSYPLVQHILRVNRQKFKDRLKAEQHYITAHKEKVAAKPSLQEQQCRDMIDTLRQEVLGFAPLYGSEES